MTFHARNPYNYDRDATSLDSALAFPDPSRTVQADALGADINNIVREFGLTGKLPTNVRTPTFADFTDAVTDYQSAQNAILEAQASFHALPANVRQRFHNSPQAFLEFCDNESNLDEMRRLGLAVPAQETPPTDGDPKPSGKAKAAPETPADPAV